MSVRRDGEGADRKRHCREGVCRCALACCRWPERGHCGIHRYDCHVACERPGRA